MADDSSGTTANGGALPAERARAVDDFVTDWLAEHRIPGAAVAVVDDGETAYAEGYGARDLTTNQPATPDTLYGVASVTKSFTALAVLQQVERTDLDLQDPITEYLPTYEGLADPPTVHELLSHSSGIPSDGASVVLISRLTDQDPVEVPLSSDDDLRRHVRGAVADHADGERFFYYNTGYTILGKLVAELDGRPFPQYVDEEVLAPLGMDRSRLAPESVEGVGDVMTPYKREDGGRVETSFPFKGVGAAGGLLSSASELADYLAFQMGSHEATRGGDAGDGHVVDPDLLAAAHEAHSVRQTYLDGSEQGYGYGWMRRSLLGDTLIEHGGSLGVSTSYVGYLDDAGLGVALACNDSPEAHPQYVGPALLALLSVEDPAEVTRFYALRAKADHVAGDYESYRGIRTGTVEPSGGTLDVTLETALGEESFEAHPASTDLEDLTYYTVNASGAKVPLSFEPTDDGLDLFYQRWRLHGV
jgi:CubicO group peptidase (beta-lactamase class C family)